MNDSVTMGQTRSPAQRNIQYIQELQLRQREAVQAARQQTEDKALLRERLSQVVLSRRTEDLPSGALASNSRSAFWDPSQADNISVHTSEGQRKGPRAPSSALSERAVARKFKRMDSEQDSSHVSVGPTLKNTFQFQIPSGSSLMSSI